MVISGKKSEHFWQDHGNSYRTSKVWDIFLLACKIRLLDKLSVKFWQRLTILMDWMGNLCPNLFYWIPLCTATVKSSLGQSWHIESGFLSSPANFRCPYYLHWCYGRWKIRGWWDCQSWACVTGAMCHGRTMSRASVEKNEVISFVHLGEGCWS